MNRILENGIAPDEGCFSSSHEELGTELCVGNILLVDDEPSILTVLAWNMNDLGLKVTTALGGQAGLKRTKANCAKRVRLVEWGACAYGPLERQRRSLIRRMPARL